MYQVDSLQQYSGTGDHEAACHQQVEKKTLPPSEGHAPRFTFDFSSSGPDVPYTNLSTSW